MEKIKQLILTLSYVLLFSDKYNEDKNQYKFQEKTQYSTNQCFPKFVTKFKDVCIDYEEEECTTGHTEKCEDTHFKSCNTIPNSKQDTKCQTVIEKICQLKRFPNHEQKKTKQNAVKCHKSRSKTQFIIILPILAF